MKKPTQGNELANRSFHDSLNTNNIKGLSTQSNNSKPPDDYEVLLSISEKAIYTQDFIGTVWADYHFNDKRYVSPINSNTFKDWLRRIFFNATEKPLNDSTLKPVLNLLGAHAKFEGEQINTFVRFGYDDDENHYLDLGDKIVRINKNGWEIIKNSPQNTPKFHRPDGFQKIPRPVNDGNLNLLRSYLNYENEDQFWLLMSWLLTAMNPAIPTPILILQGEQGTAKSTTSKVLRNIIDPNGSPLRQCPNEARDLYISAIYNPVIVWDNLSGLPNWASDALCRICSGSGFSARVLYTDSDLITIQVQRPIILNGIDAIATKGDLLDRSIVISLPFIESDERIGENSFWSKFASETPKILGALLDVYVEGLRNYETTNLNQTPRMADYAKWISACEKALVQKKRSFLSIYHDNQEDAIKATLTTDPVATVLLEVLEDKGFWEGTATSLVEAFQTTANNMGIRYKMPSHRTLRDNLERLKPLLRKINIHWEWGRETNANMYKIWKA